MRLRHSWLPADELDDGLVEALPCGDERQLWRRETKSTLTPLISPTYFPLISEQCAAKRHGACLAEVVADIKAAGITAN
jgi:hypothetical protein